MLQNVASSLQGYYGCAIGKAQQNGKTEIEKIKVYVFSNEMFFLEWCAEQLRTSVLIVYE